FAWHTCGDEAERGAAEVGVGCIVLADGDLDRLTVDTPAMAPCERAPDDTAVILYTSGTTGKPKGAQLTHANLARNAEITRRLFGLDDDSVVVGALPLFHSFGQTCTLNATFLTGATLVLVPRFEPRAVLSLIEEQRATVFCGVPTMYGALLEHVTKQRF